MILQESVAGTAHRIVRSHRIIVVLFLLLMAVEKMDGEELVPLWTRTLSYTESPRYLAVDSLGNVVALATINNGNEVSVTKITSAGELLAQTDKLIEEGAAT